MPMFRNTLFHLHRQVGVVLQLPVYENGTEGSETSASGIESIQIAQHSSRTVTSALNWQATNVSKMITRLTAVKAGKKVWVVTNEPCCTTNKNTALRSQNKRPLQTFSSAAKLAQTICTTNENKTNTM
jgi:hypothetical protein